MLTLSWGKLFLENTHRSLKQRSQVASCRSGLHKFEAACRAQHVIARGEEGSQNHPHHFPSEKDSSYAKALVIWRMCEDSNSISRSELPMLMREVV